MEERIKMLQSRLDDSIKWKEENARTQIKDPVGAISTEILKKDSIFTVGETVPTPATGNLMIEVEVQPSGDKFWLYADLG